MVGLNSNTLLRWLALVSIIWLQSINGTNTNFPSYSTQLKSLLSLTQLQLNNLAFASDAGKLFGFVAGLAALYFPLWLVLFIGTTLGLLGYGLQYLLLTSASVSSLNYWYIFTLTVVGGNSICWINTVCYIVAVRNFPFHLQAAAGLSTSYVGLSAMIYTAVVNALFGGTTTRSALDYLLLNAIVPMTVSFVTAPFIGDSSRTTSNKGSKEVVKEMRIGFFIITLVTVSTGIYAVVISSLSYGSQSGNLLLPPMMNLIGIMMCLALPIVVPLSEFLRGYVKCDTSHTRDQTTTITTTRVCDESALSIENDDEHEQTHSENDDDVVVVVEGKMHVIEEIGAKQMLTRLNFWLYFLVYFLGATVGLVYLNNLGQIAESRGWNDASSLVSLSSAFGFFGRLLPCLFHYIWSRWGRIVPGPACIAGLTLPLSASFFLLLLDGTNLSLCISTAVIGVCTGAITTIAVSVTTELFGAKNFGVNHNLVVTNIPLGSILLGDLAAFLYRSVAAAEDAAGGICLGLSCYRDTFLIWGSLSFVGSLIAFVLYYRTRKFYHSC